MLPKPSTPLPPSKHAHDDDTSSLISVPSLTGTGSTADSISVLGESPISRTAHKSLIDTTQKPTNFPRLHSFRFIHPSGTRGKLSCQMCKAKPKRSVVFECENCAFRLCQRCSNIHARLPSCQSESRLELIEGQHDSPSNVTGLRTFLLDKDNPCPLTKLAHYRSTLQTIPRQGPQQVVIRDDEDLALRNDDKAIVASNHPFRVSILARYNNIDAHATKCEGELCYITNEILEPYNIDPDIDRVRIAWKKFGEPSRRHTWFEILKKGTIGGNADLYLGRWFEERVPKPNIGEPLKHGKELDLTEPRGAIFAEFRSMTSIVTIGPPTQSLGTKNCATHREDLELDPSPITTQEGSCHEATEEECSWISSSDESPTTLRGHVETQKEQIVSKITLTVTRWLRSHFTRVHASTHEATAASCEGRNTAAGVSAQSSIYRGQRAGKRKSGNGYDGGENDDDGTIRPPYSRVDDIKGKGKDIARFACPYFKYNPTKYRQWPIYPGPGWPDVHRVKGHLYRKHRQPKFRCVRCWQCFDSEQDYVDHQRALVSCELGERESIEGFDANQETQLRSRKGKGHIVSETDKWNTVYQILFPHVSADKIPSPFYEYETPTYEALTECQEYVLREIPLRLREILMQEFDRDLQIIEQSLQRRAIECTRTIVASLFEEFRKLHQQGTVPNESQDHAGPSSSQAQPPWLHSMESSRIFLDQTDFDFNFAFADGNLTLFGDVQLRDILEAPTDPEDCALKQSNFGYGSNNVEQPNEASIESMIASFFFECLTE